MTGETDPYDEEPACGEAEELKQRLGEEKKIAEELATRLKYLQADFDNYRKQFDREKAMAAGRADEKLIGELLVILDDFGLAIPAVSGEKDREGIAMIAKRLQKILAGHGLQPIESLGKRFDPRYHEALCAESCDAEDGTVLEELGKGYLLGPKVIRPAKVKIARNPVKPAHSPEDKVGNEGERNG